MTPQLIEALGIFVVLPICGAAVFWKLLDSYNSSVTAEDPYRRSVIEAGKRTPTWRSKEQSPEAKP